MLKKPTAEWSGASGALTHAKLFQSRLKSAQLKTLAKAIYAA
jgi:hypothetical protein